MTEFEQAIADWRDAIGEKKFEDEMIKASIASYGKLVDWINNYRVNNYYANFQDTSNTMEYRPDGSIRTNRKLNHTARSRQRKSYTRASEWGGNTTEAVIGTKAGEMSMKTINELTNSYMVGAEAVIPTLDDEKIPDFKEEPKFSYETSAILKHFGGGYMPLEIKAKIAEADREFWIILDERARASGF